MPIREPLAYRRKSGTEVEIVLLKDLKPGDVFCSSPGAAQQKGGEYLWGLLTKPLEKEICRDKLDENGEGYAHFYHATGIRPGWIEVKHLSTTAALLTKEDEGDLQRAYFEDALSTTPPSNIPTDETLQSLRFIVQSNGT